MVEQESTTNDVARIVLLRGFVPNKKRECKGGAEQSFKSVSWCGTHIKIVMEESEHKPEKEKLCAERKVKFSIKCVFVPRLLSLLCA
jgi:hypothetical protein